jgi:hypothetical protein
MVQEMRMARRLSGWVLTFALALVPCATCLMGAQPTDAQMACCAAMHHHCDGMSVERDCCLATSPNPLAPSASVSPSSHLAVPPLVVVNTIAEPEPPHSGFTSSVFDVRAPKPSSRPTYLFVSVFRL